MARKVVTQTGPAQRRSGINRAQLKALAAQQAMSETATRRAATRVDATEGQIDLSTVATTRRRAFMTREQEYAYIRSDLARLVIIATILLVVLVAVLLVLR